MNAARLRRWAAAGLAVPLLVMLGGPGVGAAAPTIAATAAPSFSGFEACTQPELTDFRCGTLTVPLDRTPGTHDTRTLDLSVLEGGNPDADRTLLMLTGGPGQPGPSIAPRVIPLYFADILDDYRILMLDQRGTGDRPLDCPELQLERAGFDLHVPSRRAVVACEETIGPDRAHYTTTASVADFEALRTVLGIDEWAVNGVSYGTYTGQRYAAAHPDRITHLVIDSVVPLRSFDAMLVDTFSAVARVYREVCASPERGCPGDPLADLRTVLERYPEMGPWLYHVMSASAFGAADSLRDTPERLHAAANGDLAPLDELREILENAETPASVYSQGVQAATFCADAHFPWGGAHSPEHVRDARADAAVGKFSAAELYPFNAETARGNGIMTMCEYWPRVRDPQVPASELRIRGVDTLILQGERDLSTPMHWAQLAHDHIPGSRLIVVPDEGHGIQNTVPAVRAVVARFLLS